MKSDRFLLFLLIGIGGLVLLAVGLFLLRSGAQQAYGDDSTPEGVLRNYIIAVQKQDYTRAYSYLADTPKGKPSLVVFQKNLIAMQNELLRTGVEIGATQLNQDDTAVISVNIIYNAEGLFSSAYRNLQSVIALREKGSWKIYNIPYPYGDYGWYGGYDSYKIESVPMPED
jgi:hypothetical protein